MSQAEKVQRRDHGEATYVAQRHEVYDKHRPHPMRDGVGKFRGFHPLLGLYRDPAKESAASHAEGERGVLRGNAARDAQLRNVQVSSRWRMGRASPARTSAPHRSGRPRPHSLMRRTTT